MNFCRSGLTLLLLAAAGMRAQSTVPAVSQTVPAQAIVPGTAAVTIDLADYFNIAGVSGQVVQFDTVLGTFNVELFATAAPVSVQNFLTYVGNGAYSNTLIHRSAALGAGMTNRIIQGGGYDPAGNSIAQDAPIVLEYNLPNARGTIAMARATALNSATSEWFFNVDDNSSVLGASNNGGYAVFGRVIGTGMSVVDAIAALPTYNLGGALTDLPLRDVLPGQTVVQLANEIIVNGVASVPVYPPTNGATAVLAFAATNSSDAAATAALAGTTLTLTPAARGDTSVGVQATDTNGNAAMTTFAAGVGQAAVAAGGAVVLSAGSAANPAPAYQWQRNGTNVSAATNPVLPLTNVQPADAGLYSAFAPAGVDGFIVLGVATTSKVIGTGTELQPTDIHHPNGNIFDQVLLTGTAETITADPGQITRTSFIDLDDDIVQVEFTGPGTLSLTLDNASGPALPVNYSQAVNYMKGHASLVITGATENTNVAVFSVGRLTAFDPTGGFNFLLPISATNNPANNGSALFAGHGATQYGGIADLAFIAIASANGKFGGVRASNANFHATTGVTGLYAPGVQFVGPVYLGNVQASDGATPMIVIGSAGNNTWITGGDLRQANGRAVEVRGLTQLWFKPGTDSQGNALPARDNAAVLEQDGTDVTDQIVVNPGP